MKRIGTALFSFIVLTGFHVSAQAQVSSRAARRMLFGPMPTTGNTRATSTITPITAAKGAKPLALQQTDSVSYFQDTTGDNWWLYGPVLDVGPDSMNNIVAFGDKLYLYAFDTIGPLKITVGTEADGVTPYDTIAFDTNYRRVVALRVSTPTDIKFPRLDSLSITFFPVNINPTDSLLFFVTPIVDEPFVDQNNNPVDTLPIPDFFAQSNGYSYLAKGSIAASAMTDGQLNTITVPLGHKYLGSRTQFAIMVYVAGPNFITDTVAYQMDANLLQLPSNVPIDTDGSLGSIQGEAMRTYYGSVDAGNLILTGYNKGIATPPFRGPVGGIGYFLFGYNQFSTSDGKPTGYSFNGNLVLVTYFSGTPSAVDPNSAPEFSLDGNYPNPVGASSEINYNLAQSGPVSLTVYNTLGQQVSTVVNAMEGAGEHSATFNAGTLPNGMYYYKLQSGDFTATRTMVINR